MPGIRIDTPIGDGWDYSLDSQTWQSSPKFSTKPDGSAFVVGTLYTVHCRHQEQNIIKDVTIIFGEDSSEAIFDTIAKRGTPAKRGWTDQILRLMGGIISDLPTTTDADYATVVIDDLGKMWRRGGKILDYIRVTGPNAFPKNQTGQFVATAYYTDGTSKPAIGAVFTVQGVDATINFASGLMTPGPNAEVGGAYTVTATFNGKTHSKGTTLTDPIIAFTVAGAPKYFEPVGLLGPNYDGSLDVVNCFQITGWVADLNHPNIPAQARIYINGILATTITATQSRSDVSQANNLTNTTGHIYGFSYNVPSSFRNGTAITVELKPVSGNNAFRFSPKTSAEACLDLSNLLNVAQSKTVTAEFVGWSDDWLPAHLTDDNNATGWTSSCIAETTPSTIQIDLNGTAAPQTISIMPHPAGDGATWLPFDYVIWGSLDGTSWFVMCTVLNQSRTSAEIVLPVEKDLSNNYRTVRYVKLVTSRNALEAGGSGCGYVRFGEIRVLAPTFTPLDGPAQNRQPQKLVLFGDSGMNEGTNKDYQVFLFYTNGDSEDVTTLATLSITGTDVGFALVGNQARLTAATNSTAGDTRTVTPKASYLGLSATKDVNVYDASITVYIVSYRIDRIEDSTTITEGGAAGTFKITAEMSDGSTQQYTQAGAYGIIAPYPDGMTATTGANAIGTVTLPAGSITANLNSVLRFTFPAGGGFIEKTIALVNVADTGPSFTGYDITGDLTLNESATATVTGNYQVIERYDDNSTRLYTGGGAYSVDPAYPNGLSYATGSAGTGTVTLPANSITGDVNITLRFTFPGNSTITKTVQLVNVASPAQPSKIMAVDFRYFHDVSATFHWYVKTDIAAGVQYTVEWPAQGSYAAQIKANGGWLNGADFDNDPAGYQKVCALIRDTPAQFKLYLRTVDNPSVELQLTINRPSSSQARQTIYTAP
ncbi:discoidin domain-containing protein [Spirosoma aureum]|uniref:Discoidin domain-containing protein n=1 Tax=Spirosoma aureum TaxID=2692134 RepID=A0A6G9ATP7_9BACT|nr:discoidin domain-containing protein [Spirosoma aureum]QIP15699.1 discoidin domain-containing protein [Spirosoma aureum]